mmetsp:Transcript_123800/g.174539  ORF Transcript_123800/g.174539 Transcript_123800/m.174539 type:complete len:241 (-) Transcript_123800:460-1182(-)
MHVGHRLGGLIRRAEAHEAKALALAVAVQGHGGGSDASEGLEELLEASFVNAVVEILDVKIHTALAGIHGGKLGSELSLPLGFRLRTLAVHLVLRMSVRAESLLARVAGFGLLAPHVLEVHLGHGFLCGLHVFEGHKRERTPLGVLTQGVGGNRAELTENAQQLVVIPLAGEVLDIDICEVLLVDSILLVALLEETHLDCPLTDHHAIHLLDGLLGSLLCFVMDEAVTVRVSGRVSCNLA